MKIISIKEVEKGGADIVYELSPEDITILKAKAKKDGVKFTQGYCNKVILKAIEAMIEQEEKK